jgi:PadR family transcriptional regulator AphA
MGRSNKTEFALLGLLDIEPMSGYDMRAFIERSIGHFWQESYGQIYPALKRLADRGLVSSLAKTPEGPRDRRVYQITEEGRRALRDWIGSEAEPQVLRHELLLKLFLAPSGHPDAQVRNLKEYLETQKATLTALQETDRQMLDPVRDDPRYVYWHSTLRYGVLVAQARKMWCEETLARLASSGVKPQSGDKSKGPVRK